MLSRISLDNQRVAQLDAIRGLAAISVVMSHYFGMFPYTPLLIKWFDNTPMHIFWDGAAAVDLFFVLSGFCIAIPYVRKEAPRKINYIAFVIRRFFRLYPAYIVAVFICFIAASIYIPPGPAFMSGWGDSFWKWESLTLRQWINTLSLVLWFDTKILNPPVWSLVVEMRMAFFLPFFLVLILRFPKWRFLILLLLLGASLFSRLAKGQILSFAGLFWLGILLSDMQVYIKKWINHLSSKKFFALMLLGILLYESRFPLRSVFFNAPYAYGQEAVFHVLTGVGSAIIIICLFRQSVEELFSNKMGAFLGYISYSIYLIHFPVLLLMVSTKFNLWGLLPVLLVSCMFLAYLMYKYIELPGIKIGRKISNIILK